MPGIGKLMRGILRYRTVDRVHMVEQFKKIRDNPEPTAVFFTCIDSRVLASRFTYSQVGDNFIVRNAGNLVPDACKFSYDSATTEAGALDLGCITNGIRHVVVCGHSDCKAMNALYDIRHECDEHSGSPLQLWLKKHGEPTVKKFSEMQENIELQRPLIFQAETENHNFEAIIDPENKYKIQDKLSQVNTLQQLQHVASYPFLKEKLSKNEVRLHAMWFDIYTGEVYMFSRARKVFMEINEHNYSHLLYDADSEMAIKKS
ncbi:hypothetical protein ScPMuIL_017862 [Solemya velum]